MVDDGYDEDAGFAINGGKGWEKVEFHNRNRPHENLKILGQKERSALCSGPPKLLHSHGLIWLRRGANMRERLNTILFRAHDSESEASSASLKSLSLSLLTAHATAFPCPRSLRVGTFGGHGLLGWGSASVPASFLTYRAAALAMADTDFGLK